MTTPSRKYTKKVVVTDSLMTPEERAKRLKRVRNMANLSRTEMCDAQDLNINTYKGWEIARYGGLPIDGANKVIQRIAQEGIICTSEWLLTGRGTEPYIAPKPDGITNKEKFDLEGVPTEQLILQEIMQYQGQFEGVIYAKVVDDAMSPELNIGDYVAGTKKTENLASLLNKNCIVQTATGDILVRRIKKGSNEHLFMLTSTNCNSDIPQPTIYDIEIKSAAEVHRIYKGNNG